MISIGMAHIIRGPFNPGMDKWLHAQCNVGWNYLSIPDLQRLHPFVNMDQP